MLLNKENCTNPVLWGKDLMWVIDGKLVHPEGFIKDIPEQIDFLKEFHGNYWPIAKDYYNGN